MTGLVLGTDGAALHDRLAVPAIGPDEALVEVARSGVCGTDLELCEGLYGFGGVLGHEFVGTVVEGPSRWRGRRVVGEINVTCGRCDACHRGLPKHCRAREVIGIRGRDGVFASYVAIPVRNLHAVPDAVEDDEAVFTEPLAAAVDAVDRAGPVDGKAVCVVGAGRLGQLVCRVLSLAGARVEAVGRSPGKLERLAGWASAVHRPRTVPRRSFDVAFDCSASPDGFSLALDSLRPRGTVVVKSSIHTPTAVDLTRVVVDELLIVGSRCGPFDRALGLIAAHDLDLATLVDARFPLGQADRALAEARRPGRIKVLIDNRR